MTATTIRAPNHVHILRKHKEPDAWRKVTNAKMKYLRTWHLMAENPFTFPIAIGLYPITLVAETTRTIAKRVGQKG